MTFDHIDREFYLGSYSLSGQQMVLEEGPLNKTGLYLRYKFTIALGKCIGPINIPFIPISPPLE